MSLKDTWKDRRDDVDDNSAEDINILAHAIIANEDGVAEAKESAEKAVEIAEASKNVNISVEQTETGTTIIVTDRNGVQTSVNIDNNKDKINLLSHELTQRSNPLKGTASGEIISMRDVSPVEHEMEVKASSKNLLSYPYYQTTREVSGITFTDNGDGTITVNGTATANAQFLIIASSQEYYLKKGIYTVSGCPSGGDKGGYAIWFTGARDTGTGATFEHGGGLFYINITISAGTTVQNLTFKPQLEEDTTATAYTPFINVNEAKLLKQGGNLFDMNLFYKKVGAINPDGSLTVSASYVYQNIVEITGMLPKGTYTVSNISGKTLYIQSKSGDYSVYCVVGKSFTFEYDGISYLRFLTDSQAANESFTYKIMLNPGTTALPYELYITPTEYAINADGTVEGVTSLYPTTTLYADTAGVLINAEYNRDINKAFAELMEKIEKIGGSA